MQFNKNCDLEVHFLLLDDEAERDFLFGFEGLHVRIRRGEVLTGF